jgi:hypothetical protein
MTIYMIQFGTADYLRSNVTCGINYFHGGVYDWWAFTEDREFLGVSQMQSIDVALDDIFKIKSNGHTLQPIP